MWQWKTEFTLSETIHGEENQKRLRKLKINHGLIYLTSTKLTSNGIAIYRKVSSDLLLNRSYF
jgi:hypothetical protein